MSTTAEIEAAIHALASSERECLGDHLPAILPELNGDARWQPIVISPRPALTALAASTFALDSIALMHLTL